MSGPAYKLSEELLDALVLYQYTTENPFPVADAHDRARNKYRSEALFHNKVDSMHAGIMTLIGKHVDWDVLEAEQQQQEYAAKIMEHRGRDA